MTSVTHAALTDGSWIGVIDIDLTSVHCKKQAVNCIAAPHLISHLLQRRNKRKQEVVVSVMLIAVVCNCSHNNLLASQAR